LYKSDIAVMYQRRFLLVKFAYDSAEAWFIKGKILSCRSKYERKDDMGDGLYRHFQPISHVSLIFKTGNGSELESDHHHHFLCAITAYLLERVLQINVKKLNGQIISVW
jgi:hypothetical protein